jgi:hypothetical protein
MENGIDDSRRSPRAKVMLAATLQVSDRMVSVVLRDLSEHGALVETAEVLSADSDVVFRRNDLCVRGRIAWINGNLAGIAFTDPLKSDVLLRYIPRPVARSIPDHYYKRPAFTKTGMSPEEQRWSDEMRKESTRSNRPK